VQAIRLESLDSSSTLIAKEIWEERKREDVERHLA
jgi:hypothetical protein